MASYFDEHDCEPLKDGETPNHLLHLARLLIDGGYAPTFDIDFNSFYGDSKPPPPASKHEINKLKSISFSHEYKAQKCPICLLAFEEKVELKEMPCHHLFHPSCILPWLHKTNSCPVCRHELKTENEDYENYKSYKAREEQRKFELQSLHDSMYG